MLVEYNLDDSTYRKLKELLETGSFEEEKEVVVRAIHNLYERSQQKGISRLDMKTPDDLPDHYTDTEESTITLTGLCDSLDYETFQDLQLSSTLADEITLEVGRQSKDYDGFIWHFYNRIFPIKFILWVVAIRLQGRQKISFSEVKQDIEETALAFRDFAKSWRLSKCYIGFPKNHIEFLKTPRLKKTRRGSRKRAKEKSLELARTSRERFSSQFLGRLLSNGKILGACFEMELLVATKKRARDRNEFDIGFTELGKEFLQIKNPILDYISNFTIHGDFKRLDDTTTVPESILSNEEVRFIMEQIIPKFHYEKRLIAEFLTLDRRNIDELTESLLKIRYDMDPHEIEHMKHISKMPDSKLNKTKKAEKKQYEQARWKITGIMQRLQEFDLVTRGKHGLFSFYEVKQNRVKELRLA
jgi:hypothetical protein